MAEEAGVEDGAGQGRRRRRIDGGFLLVAAIAVGSALGVWITKGPERFVAVLEKDAGLLASVAPKVVAAVLLAAWLRALVPSEAIARWFGRDSGLRGLLRAFGAGVVIPGGPMTAFPIVAAFSRAGADAGAGAAFLASWLLLGANRIIVWELAFIDPQVVGWRVLLSLPFPILLGLAARAWGRPSVAADGAAPLGGRR